MGVAHSPDISHRTARWATAAILLSAFALRLAFLARPHAWFADEIFQYLEPAHRLVFGYGVTTWEYRYGIRSWLLPDLIAGPMALGGWLAPGTALYLLLPKLALVLVSLGTVAAGMAIGRPLSRPHGLAAGLVMAFWSETAFFATQALTETVAIPVILAAAALLLDPAGDRRRLLAAGALLALGGVMRFQYLPGIAVLGLCGLRLDRQRWCWALAGAAATLAMSACVDIAAGQTPFAWFFANFRINIGAGRAAEYGTQGPGFFLAALVAAWGAWVVPIAALALVGARRRPALLATALAVIASHSLIAHKEYRYIELASTILVLLAALGTAELLVRVEDGPRRRRLAILAVAGWIAASALAAAQPFMALYRDEASPKLEAFAWLRDRPHLCGIALSDVHWSETGGYAYLHRPVPLYVPDERSPIAAPPPATAAGYDTVIARAADPVVPPGFARVRCFGTADRFAPRSAVCVWQRAGGCDPEAAARYEIRQVLHRADR